MKRRIVSGLMVAILCAACGSSGNGSSSPRPNTPTVPPAGATGSAPTAGGPAAANALLTVPKQQIPPPPIVTIPRSTVTVAGATYDVFQAEGNRLRLLCQQPCQLDDRLIDADYAGYQVMIQMLVRNVGFDVVDAFQSIDVHLTRDDNCRRAEGEIGLSGEYTNGPKAAFICVYLTETDIASSDPATPMTPETAVRMGGLGVFAHEYLHVLLFGRFTFSSHDFIFPIENATTGAAGSPAPDLCSDSYQSGSPLTYELCKTEGFTYAQLIASLRMVDRLYQDGHGNVGGAVGVNQYLAILNHLLGKDVTATFTNIGYMKIIYEEGPSTPYKLPYASESCSYDAAVTADTTIPLGTTVDVNSSFDKTWAITNAGTCSWEGVGLVSVGGEDLSSGAVPTIAPTAGGAAVDVTVRMTAPAGPGVHAGEYRLRAPSGNVFGPIFNLVVYARPGCSVPAEFSSLKAEPATIGAGALSMLTWGQVTNVDKLELVGFGETAVSGGRVLVQPDQTTTYTLRATCGASSVTKEVTVTVDTSLPAFAITNVTAAADPPSYSGPCEGGKRLYFTGEFVSNGPGVVLYRWDRMDGMAPNVLPWTFDAAGSQRLTSDWQLSGTVQGWMELKILAPVESEPARANFSLACT
jgi:hypothetical protein